LQKEIKDLKTKPLALCPPRAWANMGISYIVLRVKDLERFLAQEEI